MSRTICLATSILICLALAAPGCASRFKKQEKTIEEIRQALIQQRDDYQRQCMCHETYRHNSTCAISNVNNIAEFKAVQYAARLLAEVVEAFDKDLTSADPDEAWHGHCISGHRF